MALHEKRISDLEKTDAQNRLTKVEMQMAQLVVLPEKIDRQGEQISQLGHQLKVYLGWVAGGIAVFSFLMLKGEAFFQFLGKGVL